MAAAQAAGERQVAAVQAEVAARDGAISELERELAARDDRMQQMGALVRGCVRGVLASRLDFTGAQPTSHVLAPDSARAGHLWGWWHA